MKKLLSTYAAYNLWADERLVEVIGTLDETQCHQYITSSFPSLYDTLKHVWQAGNIWQQRLQKQPTIVIPTLLTPTMKGLTDALLKDGEDWEDWITGITEDKLQEEITYKNMKGDTFTAPYWELLQHIYNHATFHRGQVVTILRQLGVITISSTDFVTYTRL